VRAEQPESEGRGEHSKALLSGEVMRITLLGHASLIVEMDGAVCPRDCPVLASTSWITPGVANN